VIYPVYYSGGQSELILGGLLGVENFRDYDAVWGYMWNARNSLRGLDISTMEPYHDYVTGKTGNELCFTNGHDYAIYLPEGGSFTLNVDTTRGAGIFSMRY